MTELATRNTVQDAKNTAMLRPAFKVSIDGKDMKDQVRERLCSMSLDVSKQNHADKVEIEFEDTDGRLSMPSTGVSVEITLGFEGSGMCLQGTYTVDEVEHRGEPDTLTVHARSARIAGPLAVRKERSWSHTTVAEVIKRIAGEHNLTPRIADRFAGDAIEQMDQTESDMAFLRRLGRHWDAVATVKNGCLIFAPVGQAQTPSGKALPSVTIKRSHGDRHRYHSADRNKYTGVRARWYDLGGARGHLALAGKNGHVKVLRGDYPSEADAKRAAEAELARMKRGAATFEIELAVGRPDVFPEMPVVLVGWNQTITSQDWIIARARHRLTSEGGFTTTLELENAAAAAEQSAVDENDEHQEAA
ncbi:contractile injection system protein, VgrG/Pvc8 family [Dyella sp. ASV21]|uniref:contractile injection system protein, VgrG/Pvc8 family n=1 Tax=Dyella sp. ASV21 TaxID=2795114 RepID=UPI0018EDC872|nr:contractile injection system protein, VgrG/Pvc8 family [Dyella sp. ASV21]